MNLSKYPVERLSFYSFRFFSHGKSGIYEMRVIFSHIQGSFYNLGFGVWDQKAGDFDDLIEIRNGDTDKILRTVVSALFQFLSGSPQLVVSACGSTPARTRKYQMGIIKHLNDLEGYTIRGFQAARDEDGHILGYYPKWKGVWREVVIGAKYDAFLIYRK